MKLKNNILMMLLATIPALSIAQKAPFSLEGKIGNLSSPAKIYIDYMDNGVSHEDSTILVNGAFTFKGTISDIATARIALSHEGKGKPHAIYSPGADVAYVYFGKEKVKITSKDSLSNALFTGSKIYDEYVAYNKVIGGTIMDLTKAVNIDFAKGTPEQQKDTAYVNAVDRRYRQNIKNRAAKQLQFAKDHPNSYFGMVALSESAGDKVNVAVVEPIYNAMSPALRASDTGKELAQRIKAMSSTATGVAAPLFTQNDVDGKAVSLADYKGKIVLVEFWASWCSPCRAENPNLRKQYELYHGKGFEILGVSLDSDKAKWTEAIAKDQLPWVHVSDLKGWNNAVGRLYGVRAVPASFLVDAEGKIIASGLRGEPLNKKLAELFL